MQFLNCLYFNTLLVCHIFLSNYPILRTFLTNLYSAFCLLPFLKCSMFPDSFKHKYYSIYDFSVILFECLLCPGIFLSLTVVVPVLSKFWSLSLIPALILLIFLELIKDFGFIL